MSADDVRVAYPLFQAERSGSIPTSALQLFIGEIDRDLFRRLNRLWHSRLPECGNLHSGVCYGAQFDGVYYAVAWWSTPVARLLNNLGIYELRRMAVADDAPKNTASRFLAVMVRLLRKSHPQYTRLISYQDTEVHTGTIYKAAGWKMTHTTNGDEWTRPNRKRKPTQSNAAKHRWELAP